MTLVQTIAFSAALVQAVYTGASVFDRSEVVFMYQADANTYAEYGATVVAWGGKPRPENLEGVKGPRFFGSVGMVTEFSRYYERFPQNYSEGLCRDVNGAPVKVPWLTDHQHRGIPYWWCCTQQPLTRQYLRERVIETVKAGAYGVHIDDHMGTAGGLWLGICFCDRCLEGFKAHLKNLSRNQLDRLGIANPDEFNFRSVAKEWIAADKTQRRSATWHPLWPEWSVYQCRAAAAFMEELHTVANATAGRPVPMGANAGLLWPRHLADYKTLDLFSAETDHHAGARRFADLPLLAYRIAEAVDRPYAATASGGDWAFIKEHNLPGLVRGWIALAYAGGQLFMAPHRQWCYTPEKGTHWYNGPADKFVPLYRFVRAHRTLFDGFETMADLAVVLPHRAYARNQNPWFDVATKLAAANVSYKVLLGGDEIVDCALKHTDLDRAHTLLVPDKKELVPADRELLERHSTGKKVFTTVEEALAAIQPAVRATAGTPVRILPRVKAGSAVIHLLNYDYDSAPDDVRPMKDVRLALDPKKLGLSANCNMRWITPDGPEQPVKSEAGSVVVPALGLWGMLVLEDNQ